MMEAKEKDTAADYDGATREDGVGHDCYTGEPYSLKCLLRGSVVALQAD